MVKAAGDAWLSGALTQHSNRLSTKAIFAVGKRDFGGRDKGLETVPEIQLTDYRDKKRARIRGQFGVIRN